MSGSGIDELPFGWNQARGVDSVVDDSDLGMILGREKALLPLRRCDRHVGVGKRKQRGGISEGYPDCAVHAELAGLRIKSDVGSSRPVKIFRVDNDARARKQFAQGN